MGDYRYRYHARVRTPNGVGLVQGRHIAADGTVRILVTHLPDQVNKAETLAAAIEGKECHNGMIYKFYQPEDLQNG